MLRSVVREALEEHGYRMLEATTPAEAVAISRALGGRIHLLLTDVIMPGLNGKQLAAQIVADRPDTQIIFYLEKPIPTAVLLRTVREMLTETGRGAG